MAEDGIDLPVTQGVINSSGVELRRDAEEPVVPHYRRASIASCHDFCKYGRKHDFEAKKRHSMTDVVTESPLCGISEVGIGETKTSMTRHRASFDPKLTNRTSVVKPSESVYTNPMKTTSVVKLKESVNSAIPMPNTPDSKVIPTKLPNSQKQVKKEVPVNRKKTSLMKTKPLIHPKSHTSESPRIIRPVSSSVSLKVEKSSKSTVEPVENSLRSTMEPVETSSGSTTELVESSSRSTADPVETSSKSSVELVEVSSKSTAKRVGASLKSAVKKVETSSKSTAKRVEASSNSSAKMVETPSKPSAKRTEASPRSSAKKVEAPSKSSTKKVEAPLKSSAKRVEASLKATVKNVEASPKSTVKKVESSPKSMVKKVETSLKSTVKKAIASSKSSSKVGASSKTTPLKAKQKKLSEKPMTSSKSSSVTVKKISSINPSKGSSGQRNSKLETEKRAASSNVVARKLITPSRASLPLKPSLHRVASINARKQKSLKIASQLKNQLKTRKDECKKPSKNEVEETNSCVNTLQSDQDASHDVELSPPQSVSPPQFSSSSQEDQERSEYTTSETEEDSASLEGEPMENGEALDVNVTGKPSKAGIVCSDKDKGKKMSKLKLKRGKLVELECDKTSPRKLKFRRAALLGESVKLKAENSKRSFNRRLDAGIDRIGTTIGSEKVVLRRRGVQRKRNAQGLFNLVIEETATKLATIQRSKVKALVSAFETVISLQERKCHVESIS